MFKPNITESQKKWAFTVCLLATLGLSGTFNLIAHSPQEGAGEFAQTAPAASTEADAPAASPAAASAPAPVAATVPTKFQYRNQKTGKSFDVTLGKDAQNKFTISYSVEAEGAACPAAGSCMKQISLDKQHSNNLNDIAQVISTATQTIDAAVMATPAPANETAEEKKARLAKEAKEAKEKKGKDELAKIAELCDKDEDKTDKVKCFSEKLLSALKEAIKKDGKFEISASDADEFYRDHMQNVIKGILSKFDRNQDLINIAEVRGIIEDLQSELPGKYNSVRKKLDETVRTALKSHSNSYAEHLRLQQEYNNLSRMQTDPQMKLYYTQLANEQQALSIQDRSRIQLLYNGLRGSTITGLNSALQSESIDRRFFDDVMKSYTQLAIDINKSQSAANAVTIRNGTRVNGRGGVAATAISGSAQVRPTGIDFTLPNAGMVMSWTGAAPVNANGSPVTASGAGFRWSSTTGSGPVVPQATGQFNQPAPTFGVNPIVGGGVPPGRQF